jgi:hypothetical protein
MAFIPLNFFLVRPPAWKKPINFKVNITLACTEGSFRAGLK